MLPRWIINADAFLYNTQIYFVLF